MRPSFKSPRGRARGSNNNPENFNNKQADTDMVSVQDAGDGQYNLDLSNTDPEEQSDADIHNVNDNPASGMFDEDISLLQQFNAFPTSPPKNPEVVNPSPYETAANSAGTPFTNVRPGRQDASAPAAPLLSPYAQYLQDDASGFQYINFDNDNDNAMTGATNTQEALATPSANQAYDDQYFGPQPPLGTSSAGQSLDPQLLEIGFTGAGAAGASEQVAPRPLGMVPGNRRGPSPIVISESDDDMLRPSNAKPGAGGPKPPVKLRVRQDREASFGFVDLGPRRPAMSAANMPTISEESKKHYLDRRLRAHFNMTIERAADSWGTVEQASLSTYPNENEDQRKNRRRRERQAWVKRRKTHRELTDSSAPTFSQRYTQDYLAEKAARRRRNRIKRQIALIRARAWSARYGLKDISTPPYTPPDSDDEEPDTIASSKSYTPVALALTCVGCRSLRRACSLTTAGNVAPCERCSTKNIPCVARTPQPRSARQIQNFGSQVGWFPLVITTMQSRRGQLLPVERHNLGQTWPANVFRKAAEKSIADTPEAHAIAARIAARLASFEPTPAASDEPCHSCAASNAVCSSFRPCFTCHLEGRACGPPINYVSDESEQAQPVRQTDKRPRPLDFDVEMAPDLQAAKRRMIAPGRQSSRQLGMESIDPALEVFQGLGNSNLGQDSIMVQLDTARRAHHSLQNSANPNQRALSEAQKKVNFLIRRMHENALMPGVKESMPGRNEYRGSELFGGMQDTFQNANPGIDNMGRAIMRSPTQPRQTIANTNAELTQAATQVTDPSVLPNLAEWTQADFDALAAYDWNNDTDNVMNDLLEQQPQIFDPFSISFSADQNLSGVTDDSLMDIDWSAVVDPLPAIPSEYGVALSANVGYNQGALIASKRSWVSEDFDPSRVRLEDRRVYLKESGQEVFHLERIQAHEMDPTYGHLFNCVWFGHAPYQATIETYTSIKHTVAFEVWTAANVTMARAAAASVAQFAGAIEDHIKTAKEARDAANRESMSRRVDSMGQAATTPEPPLAPAEAVAGLSILLDEIKRPFGRHNRGPPGNFLALNGAYHCDELRRPENVDICTRAPAGSCDHTDHLGSRWYVCEECHDDVNQEVWSVEDDTVTGTKSWLCVQCETNAQAARAEQIARDPNSDGPIRVGFCVCASKLKHSWLCRRHRLESIQAVQVRSALMQENMIRVRAARNLSGDCCVHCGKNVEGSEATSKAWTCYGCQESVLVSDVA